MAAPTHAPHPDSTAHTACGFVREGLRVDGAHTGAVTCAPCLGEPAHIAPVNRAGATSEGAFPQPSAEAAGVAAQVTASYRGRLSVDLTDAIDLVEQVGKSLRRAQAAAREDSHTAAAGRLALASAALAELTRLTIRASSSTEVLAQLAEEQD